MAAELFMMMAGVELGHVPYRGSPPMLIDLFGGQVQVAFDGISSSAEYIRSGKLRALAVATAARLEAFPDIPILGEFVPGYEASGWCGIVAPKNTPIDIIDKLYRETNAGLADPSIKARLADAGVTLLTGSTVSCVSGAQPAQGCGVFSSDRIGELVIAPRTLMQMTDANHLLFGSDYPHAREETMADTVSGLRALNLSEVELGRVMLNNARELFPNVVTV